MSDRSNRSHHVVALMAGRYELVRELDASSDVQRWEAFDTALQRTVLLEFLPHDRGDDTDAVDRFWRSARSSARASKAVGERVLDAGTDAETGRVFVVREWSAPEVSVVGQDAVGSPIKTNGGRDLSRFALAGLVVA